MARVLQQRLSPFLVHYKKKTPIVPRLLGLSNSLGFDLNISWIKIKFYSKHTEFHSDVMKEDAKYIFDQAVESVLPQTMVRKAMQLVDNTLIINGKSYTLNKNVQIVSFGKAVGGMVRAAEEILQDHVVGGVASIPFGIQDTFNRLNKRELLPLPDTKIKIREGSPNNIPDAKALEAASEIHQVAECCTEKDIMLTLISGGGSALLPLPSPPITLDDMARTTKILGQNGATIKELNTIRKHLEILKGGGLAKAAAPAQVVSLILSDVIGDPLDFIASGPTFPDTTTPKNCLEILSRLHLEDKIPQTVINFLKDQEVDSHSHTENFDCNNADNVIIGSNRIALDAAVIGAQRMDYLPFIVSSTLDGEACSVGKMFVKIAVFICDVLANRTNQISIDLTNLRNVGLNESVVNSLGSLVDRFCKEKYKGICILGAGETTVNVKGKGKGGRNQEMALATAIELHKQSEKSETFDCFNVDFLSAGTDGQDGPTDAAGAFCDPELVKNSLKYFQDRHAPSTYLDNNDSYNFFSQIDNGSYLLKTGLTGTNVMDIQMLLISHKK